MPSMPSDVSTMTTYTWCDVDGNGMVDFGDITLAVQVFEGNTQNASVEDTDHEPPPPSPGNCAPPNRLTDFADILLILQIFEGTVTSYPCPIPCGAAASVASEDSMGASAGQAIAGASTPPQNPYFFTGRPLGDLDADCDGDLLDFQLFQSAFDGDLAAFQTFIQGFTGPIG